MKNMELKTFIAESLNNIVDGITEAQKHAAKSGAKINPRGIYYTQPSQIPRLGKDIEGEIGQNIDFDIAVTVIETGEDIGGVGIFAAVISAGGKSRSETVNNAIHRIHFSVPVFLPEQ